MRFCPACGTRFSSDDAFCPHDGQPLQVLADAPGDDVDPLLGQVLDGRYRVDAVLGQGGMGVVYLASHVTLNKPMALKLLRGDLAKDGVVVKRFMQEAQACTAIGHPHIVDIHDYGKLPDGSAYFVMEYLDGEPLTTLIKRGRLPVEEILPIAEQIASALSAAHQRGIVHRDLKPDNIYLVRRGDDDRFVKVLDFGVAKVGGSSSKLTKTGMVFGTPHYMSPEQAAGQSVDARADVYALGVIIFEMCTGQVPFDGDTFMGILSKHMFDEPPRPSEIDGATGPLEPIILHALAKKPENRYATMDELLADLSTLRDGGVLPARVGPVVPPVLKDGMSSMVSAERVPSTRAPIALLAVVLVLLVLVGVGFPLLMGRLDTMDARNMAQGPEHDPVEESRPTEVEPVEPVTPVGIATPPEPRLVQLVSDPPGAVVFVDDVLIGNTPLEIERPTGEDRQRIRIQMRGHHPRYVEIPSWGAETITIRLREIDTSARMESMQSAERMTADPVMTAMMTSEMTTAMMAPVVRTEVVDPWADE